MRQHAVVFVDVERHESTDGRDAVERVEEEPLMFERPPPRLDHGVGELQLCEGQHPPQDTRGDQFVDLGVYVLDPRIRQYERTGPRALRSQGRSAVGGHAAGTLAVLAQRLGTVCGFRLDLVPPRAEIRLATAPAPCSPRETQDGASNHSTR